MSGDTWLARGLNVINRGGGGFTTSGEQNGEKRKEIKKGKRKRKVREREEREERKREGKRRKGERKREKRKSAFQRSELVGPRSKVQRFDKGLRFKRYG